MPRRSRPTHRRAPTVTTRKSQLKRPNVLKTFPKESDSNHQELESGPSGSEDEDLESGMSDRLIEEQEEEDMDAPRVAQWVDDEELNDLANSTSDEEDEKDMQELPETAPTLKSIQNDLSSLPFGTLRKAQQKLFQARAVSDSEAESDDSEAPKTIAGTSRREDAGHQTAALNTKKEHSKRSSKHVPTEITSKRPVTRKRTVVEVKKAEARDPRFLPLAGEFDSSRFRQQYGFLPEMHETELKTLRTDLKRARKLLASSPRDLRDERALEVDRLERAVKRAESSVNKDKRDQVEHAALERVRREEKEKQKQGKRVWYMKPSDKKKLLTKARYEALASSGGSLAVKKAIEKKQRKISQKEKRSRPFTPRWVDGESHGTNNTRRPRPGSWEQGSGPVKRQRVG
ncbi:DUF947-domain-containing protein [Neolentinus lepideus HHB14362 ss-1]|uniref:rRNA biogenesis protein RRP36 n=1 Tax=Neolentinus lepideus HHB14362 ss-1 TaxID=1314782 RepID=A0A165W1R2_9AGAM|nr:DUF947-domain-containing protein [Neolentinus lepideus HHB14362 ss-1]